MSYILKKNLVLTGMMGVGKSTIGKLLSKKLNMQFKDVDKVIENKTSLTINEIFLKKGEDFFREIEEKESLRLLEKDGLIIALGGGAFVNSNIRKKVKKLSVSIWLDLNSKFIFQRIKKNKKRPLLNNSQSEKNLEEILKKRKSIYSLANHRINCNYKNKYEITKIIKKIYEGI